MVIVWSTEQVTDSLLATIQSTALARLLTDGSCWHRDGVNSIKALLIAEIEQCEVIRAYGDFSDVCKSYFDNGPTPGELDGTIAQDDVNRLYKSIPVVVAGFLESTAGEPIVSHRSYCTDYATGTIRSKVVFLNDYRRQVDVNSSF